MTIQKVIDRLKQYHPQVNEEFTCDRFKTGDPDVECSGIIITTVVTMEVIKETIAKGANLIICHEPLFYSNADETDWLKDNAVFQEKKALLDGHGIAVWRDHDHMHGGKPSPMPVNKDMIFYGIMKTLGWEKYLIGNEKKPLSYEIPETTVGELAGQLIEKLNLKGARVVGDMDAKIRRVFLCEHVTGANWGGHDKDSECIEKIEQNGYEVMLPLEIVDWTLTSYVRDAAQQGRPKALIEIGHFNLEEAGMKYMTQWLPEAIGIKIPVAFVQSGDGFSYISRSSM